MPVFTVLRPKLHCAVIEFTRLRRASRGLAKNKVAGSAQSIGSQDAVSTAERDFQLWWGNANVAAALTPADFEGTARAVRLLTMIAAKNQPQLNAQGLGACQLTRQSTLVIPLSLYHAQPRCL